METKLKLNIKVRPHTAEKDLHENILGLIQDLPLITISSFSYNDFNIKYELLMDKSNVQNFTNFIHKHLMGRNLQKVECLSVENQVITPIVESDAVEAVEDSIIEIELSDTNNIDTIDIDNEIGEELTVEFDGTGLHLPDADENAIGDRVYVPLTEDKDSDQIVIEHFDLIREDLEEEIELTIQDDEKVSEKYDTRNQLIEELINKSKGSNLPIISEQDKNSEGILEDIIKPDE